MKSYNITPIIESFEKVVENHKLSQGSYKRFLFEETKNPYGCADAANILYTIGSFPQDEFERAEFVRHLSDMQDKETGLFHDIKQTERVVYLHDPIHTTAHCMAALELFDKSPKFPAKALEKYLSEAEFNAFMEEIDWVNAPWGSSHKPAGLFVALNLGGYDCREFNKFYFKWMWENADPETGLWRKGCQTGKVSLWEHMAGTFHYLFNHEYAHMPLRYPDKVIDSCLYMYKGLSHIAFDIRIGFMVVDWVFCLTRAMRQTAHRFDEAMATLDEFADTLVDFYFKLDFYGDDRINDLHSAFGSICSIAELQQTLRGKLYSEKPLKLVLDRRPFI